MKEAEKKRKIDGSGFAKEMNERGKKRKIDGSGFAEEMNERGKKRKIDGSGFAEEEVTFDYNSVTDLGGLRFHPSMNLSVAKFLGFEQNMDDNPYFENNTLTKQFRFLRKGFSSESGTEIRWKKGNYPPSFRSALVVLTLLRWLVVH